MAEGEEKKEGIQLKKKKIIPMQGSVGPYVE